MVAIDLSMRSTGIVRMTTNNKLIDFKVISNKKLDFEELLIWNADEILNFCKRGNLSYVAFEGLSLGGASGFKDMIQGNFWHVRCTIRKHYGDKFPIGSIPVLSWRSKVLTKDERKDAKKVKEGLKIFVVNKLPAHIKTNFENYIKKHNLSPKSIYDLADAYHIALYRNNLE